MSTTKTTTSPPISLSTPLGTRIEGSFENNRNAENAELFKAIIRKVFDVSDVIVAHHLVYVKVETRDGFDYQIVEEIPSADTLIFDHDVAKALWGEHWALHLGILAVTPVEERDAKLAFLCRGLL